MIWGPRFQFHYLGSELRVKELKSGIAGTRIIVAKISMSVGVIVGRPSAGGGRMYR